MNMGQTENIARFCTYRFSIAAKKSENSPKGDPFPQMPNRTMYAICLGSEAQATA